MIHLYLSQFKYIMDILKKTTMLGADEVSTPMGSSTSLISNDGSNLVDATWYQKVINSLQYLTFTRPNIAYVVNKLSQYMQWSLELYWAVVK